MYNRSLFFFFFFFELIFFILTWFFRAAGGWVEGVSKRATRGEFTEECKYITVLSRPSNVNEQGVRGDKAGIQDGLSIFVFVTSSIVGSVTTVSGGPGLRQKVPESVEGFLEASLFAFIGGKNVEPFEASSGGVPESPHFDYILTIVDTFEQVAFSGVIVEPHTVDVTVVTSGVEVDHYVSSKVIREFRGSLSKGSNYEESEEKHHV